MIPRLTRISTVLCASAIAFAHASRSAAAVLIEDGSGSKAKAASRASLPKTAADGLSLRRVRRAGVGASIAGPLGLAGVNLDLCLSQQTSFFGGYGGGPGYGAFAFGARRILGGENVMPFAGAGFARWSSPNRGESIGETTPAFLAESFLSDEQKRTGAISANMLYGSLGLQWTAPSGAYAGSSVYVEALLLVEVSRVKAAPTASLGYLYYF